MRAEAEFLRHSDLLCRSPRPTCKDSAFAPKPGLRRAFFCTAGNRTPRTADPSPTKAERGARDAAGGPPCTTPPPPPHTSLLSPFELFPLPRRAPPSVPAEKESGRRIGPPFSRWRPDGRIRCRKGARPTRCVSQMIPRICRFLSTFAEIRDVCTVSGQHVRLRMIV